MNVNVDMAEQLAQEVRARLAAERLLHHKQAELLAANEKLAIYMRSLLQGSAGSKGVEGAISKTFIQELEQAHTAAIVAEKYLWDAIDNIREGFAIFDNQQRLLVANKVYLKYFGDAPVRARTTYQSLLERLAKDKSSLHEDSRTPDWVSNALARWSGHGADIPPLTMRFCDGRCVRFFDQHTPDGGFISLSIDVTEYAQAVSAFESIPDGFVLFDQEDRLISYNQRYREIYPKTAPAIVPGAKFEDILRYGVAQGQYSDALGNEEPWIQERLSKHIHPESSVEQRSSDGRWLRVIESITSSGCRVGLHIDITEMKLQQEALKKAHLASESASRAKSVFLANMSHEIQTPMNGVIGMAELLCETPLSQEQRLFVETIKSSSEALLSIINDILDYSKIEAEKLTLHEEPFDLEKVIHEVAVLLQPRADLVGLDLMVDYDLRLPTQFLGDSGRIRQILTNLIGNAVKFTEKGHVLVRVIDGDDKSGGRIKISVEDTGIGISQEHIKCIFKEFTQLDSNPNRKFQGTGLGLSITRHLVELMGGEVFVQSAPEEGSTFSVELPLKMAGDAPCRSFSSLVGRALVVEGHSLSRTIIEHQLTACGISVVMCDSSSKARELLENDSGYDVVILAYETTDGLDESFIQQLYAAYPHLSIIMISSKPEALRAKLSSVNFATVIRKPILRADLYGHICKIAPEHLLSPESCAFSPLAPPRRMRVLTVDDNRTNQLILSQMVKGYNIDIEYAYNGLEAVDKFKEWQPDLIFMDISMPEMDGMEASRTIRKIDKGLRQPKIVALTAHAVKEELTLPCSDMDHYLTKPLKKSAIIDVLRDFCPEEAAQIDLEKEHI